MGSLDVGAAPSRLTCIGGLLEFEELPCGGVFSLVEVMVVEGGKCGGDDTAGNSDQSLQQDFQHLNVLHTRRGT